MNPRLEIVVSIQAGDEHEIPPHETGGAVVLGRSVGCEIHVTDTQLSRRHCRFSFEGGFVQVEDLKSRNGTHVNGRHIREKTELHHGDKVRAGGVELKVKYTEEEPERKPGTAPTAALAATKAPHKPAPVSEEISFPGYVLEGLIREGVTSRTYRVHKTDAEAPLALKFIVPDVLISPEERARFLRGARHAAGLDHRHLVRVLEVGSHEEVPYMVMEYVEGEDLERRLAEAGRPLKVASATSMGLQILSALHYIYERQLVLRSVRPDNVIAVPGSGVRLTDYDLLKALPGEDEKEVTRLLEDDVFVAPEFAPPEMITRPFLADQRADVFGAAACLYFMLTLKAPFSGALPGRQPHLAFKREFKDPQSLNPKIPDAVRDVIVTGMSNHVDKRYSTPQEMHEALKEAAQGL